jgi:hypothetical protein
MNEKIKKLHQRAHEIFTTEYLCSGKPREEWRSVPEILTKLILDECAGLTLDYKNQSYYEGWLDYREEIKRHFGVA